LTDNLMADIEAQVAAGIQLANEGLDWLALERRVGSLAGYNLAVHITDVGDSVGFRLDSRRLVALRPGDLRIGGVVTHRVTLTSTTFHRILSRETTVDHAYYTAGAIKAWDVATGLEDHRAASVLKVVFDEFMRLMP